MTHTTFDLSACDREPIHIPGSIQPHGLLLVADEATLAVVAGAGAIEARLAERWLGRPLSDLLGQDVGEQFRRSMTGEPPLVLEALVEGRSERFEAVCHRSGGYLLVELDPAGERLLGGSQTLAELDAAVRGFERAAGLPALCERAAIVFRNLSGFDRVMIYRFLDDEAGRVVAEDLAPGTESFLNHHFPAGDIPRQARALYVRNLARAIPDVGYTPAPLRPEGFGGLDLSDVGLRSISPIHVQYLRNMGVGASASFSIVRDGVLWGLVVCHHPSALRLSREQAITGTALVNALARQIRAKEQAADYEAQLRLRTTVDELADHFSDDRNPRDVLADMSGSLRRLLGADGFAFFADGTIRLYGSGPGERELLPLATRALEGGSRQPVVTRRLSDVHPPAAAWPQLASGMVLVPLPQHDQALIWLRVEEPEEVRWAGNPHTAEGDEPGKALTPRGSFATWIETVRGRSRNWSLEEVDAARRLARLFADAQTNRRIRRLNVELQETLAERDELLKEKDLLMREVDHRVQNSLQMIRAFLSMQAREAGPGTVADQLTEAQARLSAVSLVHRRLYRSEQRDTIELGQYLGELIGDLRSALGPEWGPMIEAELAPVLLPVDRAMPIGLVMTELIINASKYAYDGQPGPVLVQLSRHAGTLRLSVKDEGRGREATPRSDSGFGGRLVAATVARLRGALEHEDRASGLKVTVSAPIDV